MPNAYEFGLSEDDVAEGAKLGLTMPEMAAARRLGVKFEAYAKHKPRPPSAAYLAEQQKVMLRRLIQGNTFPTEVSKKLAQNLHLEAE